jgi:hypothetical protein
MAKTRKRPDQPTENLPNRGDDDIRSRAYELYEARGREPGREWEDWLQAEREIRPREEEQ